MRMEKKLSDILNKYHSNKCTPEEIQSLETWFEEIARGQPGEEPDQQTIENMLAKIKRSPRFNASPQAKSALLKTLARRYRVAAASLVFLLVSVAVVYQYSRRPAEHTDRITSNDILPGGDKAILTLADGTSIALNDQQEGLISRQDGITISKNGQGMLVYVTEAPERAARYATNTLTTPRGGSHQIILPDGSKAWLNAASSLSYPLVFSKHERRVRMTGEVYFEIAKSSIKQSDGEKEPVPFFVETDKQTIQVLGTQFNVNSYTSYPTERTTLVEGKVKVIYRATGEYKFLSPNMQAQVADKIQVVKTDVTRNVAWKNGDFIFRNEPLADILQEVMRWYDVDIVCPEHLGKIRFNGMVSRKKPLSAIIQMIASTDKVELEVKERRITVR
ncbi:DUF4974 domain-containing protein [Sphingobacterium olei]|uniref:DUF4974 domain-containing protein n=2 Tax=Sphingobacterium olei TaxID=2571155 RepID=A0A4U0NH53_9SPHI|nr:DUF4974 domain-containing protein [Sphingobacterium olei]